MIISYMDESIDMCKAGVFAVGGLLGRGPAFLELERKWGKLCKRPDINIGYFDSSWVEVIPDSQKVAIREPCRSRQLLKGFRFSIHAIPMDVQIPSPRSERCREVGRNIGEQPHNHIHEPTNRFTAIDSEKRQTAVVRRRFSSSA